jgi:tetratricopeptide (TPR) repeat protein/SAM-dependent methyltransferase
MNSSNDEIEALKRQGSELIDTNRLEEAQELFSNIVNHRPDDPEVWYKLSSINGRLGRIEEAGECCRRAIALRPDYSDALLTLGTVLLRQGHFEEALAQYRKVLQVSPTHATAFFNIGQAHAALGRYDDAVENYREAFRLNPSHHLAGVLKQQGLALTQDDRLKEAGMLFKLLCEVWPDDAEAWYVLSTIYGKLGNIDEAADCCQHVLTIQPNHCGALLNLGHVCFQKGWLDEAVTLYLKALEIDPQSIAALNSLARTCVTQNHFDKYIKAYRIAVAGMSDPTEARIAFINTIGNNIPTKYEAWLDEELKQCFSVKDIDYNPIALVTAHTLKYKYNISATDINDDDIVRTRINQIAGDDLFLAFLEKTINNDAELEIVLTKVRRALLFMYCRENRLGNGEQRVVTALAHHCFNNEYVFATDEDEERQFGDLKKAIEARITTIQSPNKALEISLSVFGMYGSLHTLSGGEHLAALPPAEWSDEYRSILAETLLYPMEERRIMADIGSIGTIRDRTTQLVKSQYEDNPYPRWLAMPKFEDANLSQLLKQEFQHFSPPDFLRGPLQILVAGCGTGRHPIQTALQLSKHHDIEILAVDISRHSLAYAIRMARQYGVKNIQFLQGDILELSQLDKRFHIIECGGVLHHMERPIEGWRVLSNLLVENGLMSIGLYSKAGRAGLEPMQEMFKQTGLTPNNDNVRAFRHRILKGELGDHRIYSRDFYSTSGCRDLLFHFVEHEYTPLQLDLMMKELNLKFIGFVIQDAKIKDLYRNHFPQDSDMTNLSLWERFEKMYPDTFAKMYQFWCQKQ